jgi:DNA mismatch repair protein MutL
MGSIVLLDDLTINQIAAGEVIERPANVVKELVENSLDANATSVSVEIENGGITYMRITDNGKGIEPDDIDLAFERHATSKIRKAEDLIRVSTMGFRGEALASIAAIAKIEMITRTKNNETGTKVIVEGGRVLLKEECGAPLGTTIIIRELFYNTPVRYKFLKKDFTEGGYIETAVERIALIHPEVGFKLTNNKKEVLHTSGNGNMTDVVYNVFGKDIASNLVDVDFQYENIRVTGVVGKPEIARSNRSNQLFYVNGRFIKDKTLSAAAEEAYRTMIPHGKFGFCVLNINIPPEQVDVNVHPAKLEVRFSEEGKVFKAIHYAIKNTLLGVDLVREDDENEYIPGVQNTQTEENANVSDTFESKVVPISNEGTSQKRTLFDIFKGKQEKNIPVKEEALKDNEYIIEVTQKSDTDKKSFMNNLTTNSESKITRPIEIRNPEESDTLQKLETNVGQEDVYTNNKDTNDVITQENQMKTFFEKDFSEKAPIPEYKLIGVAFDTYILLQMDDDIYILDQHAAHERVLYEKIKENFYRSGGKEVQMLLLPDILEVSKKDMHIIKDHIDLFEQAGFALEEFGENTIKINGVPVICYEMDTKALFLDILDGIDITTRTNKQDIEEKFIATVACKAAVKANMKLDEREIRGLLDQMLLLDNPFTCPHGRPTAIRITKNELEKKFGRR